MLIVKNWLEECEDSHEHCSLPSSTPLPTRLISVSAGLLRLELTKNLRSTPRYSTLSYCWGGSAFLKTTTSNLRDFLIRIPAERMPQTFIDAIRVTRALGLAYIWIDSLCIVQDSDDDWRKESSRMCDVYGGSYINIAASSATQPSQSCFTKPRSFVDAFSADVHVGRSRYTCEFHHVSSSYAFAINQSNLLTRAWAIQEKLLPTRTIHIGDRGAFWDCRSSIRMEASPHLHFEPVHNMNMASLLPPDVSKRPEKDWAETWKHIVASYSSAKLTKS